MTRSQTAEGKTIYAKPEVSLLQISRLSLLETLSFTGDIEGWEEGGNITSTPDSYDVPSSTI